MSPERKRRAVALAYPGENWARKVAAMSDAQVHVTYMRLLNNGQLKGISY